MENRSYIRMAVWGLLFFGASLFAYSLGWQQGADVGQQRGMMQADMARALWEQTVSRSGDEMQQEEPDKPVRHNASAGREDSGR